MTVDTYEEDVKVIRKRNEMLLSEFKEWLELKGLSEKTVEKHEFSIRFYINEYLLYYDALLPENGIDKVEDYMENWFPRKAMWASVTSVKEYGASFKKFYTFMSEKGLVSGSDVDRLKTIIKTKMDYWISRVDKPFEDLHGELVDDYIKSIMKYPFEEYLNDIDMDVLMKIVKRHKEFKTFDALHGTVCGFATLPTFKDADAIKDLFVDYVIENVLCTLEEKKKFKEALREFFEFTEDFMFTGDFVPYCGSWEFKDFETNNPKEWCLWFVTAFMLIKEMFTIPDMDFAKTFQIELAPVLSLGFDENISEMVTLKKQLAEEGKTWETFREEMFKSLPDVPLYLSEVAEEYVDGLVRELELSHMKPAKSEKVGRNDPCPCGSGKKYKKCCGK